MKTIDSFTIEGARFKLCFDGGVYFVKKLSTTLESFGLTTHEEIVHTYANLTETQALKEFHEFVERMR